MSSKPDTYALVDAGQGRKLERFGPYLLDRPCAQAIWAPALPPDRWAAADARFTRRDGNTWSFRRPLPESWHVRLDGLRFEVRCTDFGHVGLFPEHVSGWRWLAERVAGEGVVPRDCRILNLFAYSGGATLAAARLGFPVCHVDAARKMISWASRNAALNGLEDAAIRWIVEDVQTFLKRERRRENTYEGIILDPPSFGRGRRQELFKIDQHLPALLRLCRDVLSERARFVFLTCHTRATPPWYCAMCCGRPWPIYRATSRPVK